ncbi:hypothetical protein [Hufsiella ginkgonis]|uniref:Uncharacterized protein n=1 Tax=Hufsiella ginkgonis TaxID=2695274 RepID=A0A7K1XU28_9SPHI|nr:hypothetical protein [Hufsiella ginkgonis]MXV14269.1 hypothetical protein [Hufsiella ginkgonis]
MERERFDRDLQSAMLDFDQLAIPAFNKERVWQKTRRRGRYWLTAAVLSTTAALIFVVLNWLMPGVQPPSPVAKKYRKVTPPVEEVAAIRAGKPVRDLPAKPAPPAVTTGHYPAAAPTAATQPEPQEAFRPNRAPDPASILTATPVEQDPLAGSSDPVAAPGERVADPVKVTFKRGQPEVPEQAVKISFNRGKTPLSTRKSVRTDSSYYAGSVPVKPKFKF